MGRGCSPVSVSPDSAAWVCRGRYLRGHRLYGLHWTAVLGLRAGSGWGLFSWQAVIATIKVAVMATVRSWAMVRVLFEAVDV